MGSTPKGDLRAQLIRARIELGDEARARAGVRLCAQALALPELGHPPLVAGYLSVGTEPDTRALLASWLAARVRVLLPVMRRDRDLDWAEYTGPDSLRRAQGQLWEPSGPRLGVDAIAAASAVVVPALAVDHAGTRLGRGAGCYDRALARLPAGHPVVALLYDGEVLDELPAEPHDRPVTTALTPDAVYRFAPGSAAGPASGAAPGSATGSATGAAPGSASGPPSPPPG
jgi:5-formyltetrahydrofolate cyclo-ligase